MGCIVCSKKQRVAVTFQPKNPMNSFPYWFQIFDFLQFHQLLAIAPVCRIFQLHTGHPGVLSKFMNRQQTEVETLGPGDQLHLQSQHISSISYTPGFLSPKDILSLQIKPETTNPVHFQRQSGQHDSLDNISPVNNLKSLFFASIQQKKQAEKIVKQSAYFDPVVQNQDITRFEEEFSNFSSIKSFVWEALKAADDNALSSFSDPNLLKMAFRNREIDYQYKNITVTPLAVAVSTGNLKLVQIVLKYIDLANIDKGFTQEDRELNIKCLKRVSPLQLVCGRGLFGIAEFLLQRGASPNFSGVFTHRSGSNKVLVDQGVPCILIAGCPKYHNSFLSVQGLNYRSKHNTSDINYTLTTEILFIYHANPNIQLNQPSMPTPIYHVLKHPQMVALFIKNGANPNIINDKGQSPLYIQASTSGETSSLSQLIKGGALLDPPTCRPLFVAMTMQNTEAVNVLKQAGAQINGSELMPSALQVAIASNDLVMSRLVLGWNQLEIDWKFRQNGKNLFHRLAQNRNSKMFDLLVEKRTSEELNMIKQALNQSTYADPAVGDTIPLLFALPDKTLVKKLIEFQSNLSRISLAKTIKNFPNEKAVIQLLVESGIDLNKKYEGKAPVWMAYEHSRPDLISFLGKAGANLDSFNLEGMTPLQHACLTGKVYYAQILLKHRADPLVLSGHNFSCMEYLNYPSEGKTADHVSKIRVLLG